LCADETYSERVVQGTSGDNDDLAEFLNEQWLKLQKAYDTSAFVGSKTSSNSQLGAAAFPKEVNDEGVNLLRVAYGIHVAEALQFPQYMSVAKNPLRFTRMKHITDIFPSLGRQL
ncbi:MAG: hypothetical protein Q7S76_01200, partial [bacterium]|nr:hypothetical protein [bacterium]